MTSKIKLLNLSTFSLAVITSIYSLQAVAVDEQAINDFIEDDDIPSISVIGTELTDVSNEQIKSADVAEALSRNVPSISLIRRSGIANDIILRGQSKDNINVTIDNAKIYGACPNRMDPPTSHILTNNIESIEVIEGPYDVENFGTLSGIVKVKMVQPEEDLHGEVSVNFGRWNYQKQAVSLTGGNEKVRGIVSVSQESSDQYEDGDGNDFAEQIDELGLTGPASMVQYQDQHRNMDAYDKKTFMGKFYFNLIDNHEMAISYTANRSDDVLYPSSKMDASYDDSNMVNVEYAIKHLGTFSKQLDLQYYHSDVIHPMSTKYRLSSGPNSANEVVSKLNTSMDGVKIKNAFDINATLEGVVGLDYSERNWDGKYIGYGLKRGITDNKSIDNVDTDNVAIFSEFEKRYDDLTITAGARYDDVSIKPKGSQKNNDYNYFSGFIKGNYEYNHRTTLFAGFGKSSRVPDARELYWKMSNGMEGGNPDLDKTDNYEIDFGVDHNFKHVSFKTTLFHSWLKDYIYYNDSKMKNKQVNVDAKIYGFDITGLYPISDELYLDFGIAYQRGKKDKALAGQTDKDLANIAPTTMNLALNYDYMENGTAKIELVAADRWDNYDEDNGEQEIAGYGIMNLQVRHNVTKIFEVTVGVDNVFDKTYAVNNTYKDLILLTDGRGDVMMMNEPGRYYYLNAALKF
ncbi:MAG: TonB-dependent receptor [Gammaproteobacteria bacterium]|nr:TonB-dependent receptor [Gammaproteobacteria bacterium]